MLSKINPEPLQKIMKQKWLLTCDDKHAHIYKYLFHLCFGNHLSKLNKSIQNKNEHKSHIKENKQKIDKEGHMQGDRQKTAPSPWTTPMDYSRMDNWPWVSGLGSPLG